MRNSLYFVALGMLLIYPALAWAEPAPILRTEVGTEPWAPAENPLPEPKVIYGTDDRLDTYQVTDQQLLEWAAASCALMFGGRLTNNGNGTYTINPASFTVSGYPPCPGEPFATQPVAAFCSGAWLGEDLVSTAGHCFDSSDLNNVYFVFGFSMADVNTPNLVLPANQVYIGVELVDRQLNGSTGADYSIVRLDRPVNIPGVSPIEIRRAGALTPGENVGVIGHPAGLPQKIAFGADTVVRDASPSAYFVANLDTYGGNSGSPVFNPATGLMEGILVRGETDYVINQVNQCFQSNVVSNTGGSGEDCTKVSLFADIIPEIMTGQGNLLLDRAVYACNSQMSITLLDSDLSGTVQIGLSTSNGDSEFVTLVENISQPGRFEAVVIVSTASAQPNNGVVNVVDAATITASYTDADYGGQGPQLVQAQASADCSPPAILEARVTGIASGQAVFHVVTSEIASVSIEYGTSCGALITVLQSAEAAQTHLLPTFCLAPGTTYLFRVTAQDSAGNSALFPAAGCETFDTPGTMTEYHTQQFISSDFDLNGKSLTFYPVDGGADYTPCVTGIAAYPTDPAGGVTLTLGDDASAEFILSGGAPDLMFYGVPWRGFHINSNGNITFGTADFNWQESIASHFTLPRVSAFFDDLNPAAGGTVSVRELGDRVAVTYDQIRPFGGANLNSFQVEFFFDGRVRVSYVSMTSLNALVGLSRGAETPCDFNASDLSGAIDCGADPDTDGLTNEEELVLGTDPLDADTDNDQMPDGFEVQNGLDPLNPADANSDLDGDLLSNLAEYNLGTGVNNPDTDNDQLPDGWEVLTGLDPLDNSPQVGTNDDPDSDNLSNLQEYQQGTLPLVADSDGDGLDDDIDPVPDGSDTPHSADRNSNWSIGLSELLRVVQFFNVGGLYCDPASEDGYAPGTGDQTCAPHASDYSTQNWIIDLIELLRLIQLYNSFGYTRNLLGEDGYAPNPPA